MGSGDGGPLGGRESVRVGEGYGAEATMGIRGGCCWCWTWWWVVTAAEGVGKEKERTGNRRENKKKRLWSGISHGAPIVAPL